MRNIKENMIPIVTVFFVTAFSCVMLLILTGMISKEAIRENTVVSAKYFYNQELYPYLIEKQFNTRGDNFADAVLVNIMYHIDGKRLIPSLLEASYYRPEHEYIYESLYHAVEEEKEPNISYFRYWHGMQVVLRPLFVFTDITGARVLLGILMAVLTLLTSLQLYRNREKALAVIYLLGNVFIQSWVCFFCIEYVSTFLLMHIITIAVISFWKKYQGNRDALNNSIRVLMVISGVTTCFFDFLTTETLTVTVPLFVFLVLVWRSQQLGETKNEVLFLTGSGFVWGVSYGMMFGLKWFLSSLLLGREAFKKALEYAAVRMTGSVSLENTSENATLLQKLLGAIGRNQGALFPLKSDMKLGTVILLFAGLLFLGFALVYVFRGKNFSGKLMFLFLLLCLVPYGRYVALANHAYIHFFFTYRAQLILILVLFFCSWEFGIKNFFALNR